MTNSAYDSHPTLTAYERAPTFSMWLAHTQPKDEMLWKGGFAAQAEWMPRLAVYGAHSEPRVIATHRSKSIDLPVPAILIGNPSSEWAIMMVRDNFHDVNLGVVSSVPLTLDLGLVFEEMSREDYQAQKQRAQAYGMPRVTDAQWEDGSWYSEWSNGELVLDNGKIWRAPRAFAEGISRVPGLEFADRYEHGCTSFTSVLQCGTVDDVIGHFAKIVLAVRDNLFP